MAAAIFDEEYPYEWKNGAVSLGKNT